MPEFIKTIFGFFLLAVGFYYFLDLKSDVEPDRVKQFLEEKKKKYKNVTDRNRQTILEELKIEFTQDVSLLREVSKKIVSGEIGSGRAKDFEGVVMRAAMAAYGQIIPSELHESLLGLKGFVRDSLKQCLEWPVTTQELLEIQKTALTEAEVKASVRYVNSSFFKYLVSGPFKSQIRPDRYSERKYFDRFDQGTLLANGVRLFSDVSNFGIGVPSILVSLGLASAAIAVPTIAFVPISATFFAIGLASIATYYSIIFTQNRIFKLLDVLSERLESKTYFFELKTAEVTPLEESMLFYGLAPQRLRNLKKNRAYAVYNGVSAVVRSILNRINASETKQAELDKFYSMVISMKNPPKYLSKEAAARSKKQFNKLVFSVINSNNYLGSHDYPIYLAVMRALDVSPIEAGIMPMAIKFILKKGDLRESIRDKFQTALPEAQMAW